MITTASREDVRSETRIGFHGPMVLSSVSKLNKILEDSGSPDGEKVQHIWYGKLNDHILFTVYDYKEDHLLGVDEETWFHIGSKDLASAIEVSTALDEALKQV